MEIDPAKIIKPDILVKSIGNHKYEYGLIYLKNNPEITSVVISTHYANEYLRLPAYKWVIYRLGNDVWERVFVNDVVKIQQPFRIGFFN